MTYCLLPTANCQLPTAFCQLVNSLSERFQLGYADFSWFNDILPFANCQLSTANWLIVYQRGFSLAMQIFHGLMTYCLLPTVNCQLPTVNCQLV
jgi:hypothetical protein